MVTAETAVVLPVLLLVLAGAVCALVLVGAQLRCVDAAREGARAAARGEDGATVTRIAGAVAPDDAVVVVTGGDGSVRVEVTAETAPLGPLPLRVRVSAVAVARVEPGADGTR
jgi:Flp pilus assembly protein TadG